MERRPAACAEAICQSLLCGLHDGMHGEIIAVFDHAANVMTKTGLVTVLTRDRTLIPHSIRLCDNIPFPAMGWERDSLVRMDESGVSEISGRRLVNLKTAAVTDLNIYSRLKPFESASASVLSAEPILRCLRRRADVNGLSVIVTELGTNPFADLIRPRLQALFLAVAHHDENGASAAAARIAGCGPGLTPSSDDLLSGYMAALHAFKAAGLRKDSIVQLTRRMASSAAEKTNSISAAFLLQSGNGYASEEMILLLREVLTGAEDKAELAAARVGMLGSTSGSDMLCGVALAILNENGGIKRW